MTDARMNLAQLFRDDGPGLSAGRQDMITGAREHVTAQLENAPTLKGFESGFDDAISEMLDIDVADIFIGAWTKLSELREYRDEARHPPDETALVPLLGHTVRSRHQPTIRIFSGQVEIAKLRFDVEVKFVVSAATLKIRKGRIMEIASGEYTMSGQVALAGKTLLEKTSRPYKIPGRVTLGEGVEIPA